jgi:hypothetical protein
MVSPMPRFEAGAIGAPEVGAIPLEPIFSTDQVAQYLGLDTSTIRRLFIDRPGVIKIGRTSAHGGRRSYVTLRIPLGVLKTFVMERTQ